MEVEARTRALVGAPENPDIENEVERMSRRGGPEQVVFVFCSDIPTHSPQCLTAYLYSR